MRGRLTKYGVCALFVAAMVFGYLQPRGFAGADAKGQFMLLCDALTVPGVLLLCAGALIWVSGLGALDGLGYGLRMAFRALIPGNRLRKEKSYHEYVLQRQKKRLRGYGFLLISGAVPMALSLVFLGLYYL